MKTSYRLALLAILSVAVVRPLYSQSLSLSKSVYNPSETIVVKFSGFPGNTNDWIGLAAKGLADDKYTVWKYTAGAKSGSLSFDGLPSGEYEARGYYNNGYEVKARVSFRVGNTDQNLSARTEKSQYKPWEKIRITYSGLPGNSKDWISYAAVGSADDKYYRWAYTDGKQSGTLELDGAEEGKYEVRVYFNGEGAVKARYPFSVSNKASGKKACRTELSSFYQSMNSLGLCWGRLGSDAFVPETIAAVQAELSNVAVGINAIGCLDFEVGKISSFSSRLGSMSRTKAVAEIDALIKEIQASVTRAGTKCDKGALLESLFETGIHLGAAQAIASSFICMAIPSDWQGNLRHHLNLVSSGISGFGACIPGVSPTLVNGIPVGAPNAYQTLSVIIGVHEKVLWSVSLSDCCCSCK